MDVIRLSLAPNNSAGGFGDVSQIGQQTAASGDMIVGVLAIVGLGVGLWLLKVILTPVYQRVVGDLKHPSHLLYLVLFGLGAYGSSKFVFELLTRTIDPGPYRTVLTISLLAFFGTNALHQYLIYRSVVEAEDPQSDHSKKYSPWWIGRRIEVFLRFLALALLLMVARELGLPDGGKGNEVFPLAIANAGLFTTFLLWNVLALKNVPPQSATTIKKDLQQAIFLDVIAVIMWISAATPGGIIVVILASMGYAVAVLWTRIRGDERLFRLYVVLAVTGFLIYQHWELFSSMFAQLN